MKSIKFLMVSALCAMTLIANAAPTAMAKISIASASGNGNDVLILVESSDCSSAIETATGKDIEKVMNDANDYSINLYAVSNSTNLSAIGTDDLTNTAITFKSNKSETSYTMTFANVIGTVKLYDAVEDQEITLANAGSYAFTAAANSTIADRFVINYVPAAKGICFNYEKLQLTKYDGAKVEVFADGAATAEVTATVAGDAQYEINLSALASGKYIVKIDLDGDNAADEEYVISVKPAITVVP